MLRTKKWALTQDAERKVLASHSKFRVQVSTVVGDSSGSSGNILICILQCIIELANTTMASRDRKLYPQRACASYYASGEILEELQVRYLVLLRNTSLVSKTGLGKIGKFGRNLIFHSTRS